MIQWHREEQSKHHYGFEVTAHTRTLNPSFLRSKMVIYTSKASSDNADCGHTRDGLSYNIQGVRGN